jgi:hypothetical protein
LFHRGDQLDAADKVNDLASSLTTGLTSFPLSSAARPISSHSPSIKTLIDLSRARLNAPTPCEQRLS